MNNFEAKTEWPDFLCEIILHKTYERNKNSGRAKWEHKMLWHSIYLFTSVNKAYFNMRYTEAR